MTRAFPSVPETAAAARAFVQESTSADLPEPVLGDALLLTTELVTNAIRHAEGDADDPIEVAIGVGDRSLRVAVRDQGPGFDPSRTVRSDEGGWGLDLVRTVARDWGVRSVPNGTEVWFELDVPVSAS